MKRSNARALLLRTQFPAWPVFVVAGSLSACSSDPGADAAAEGAGGSADSGGSGSGGTQMGVGGTTASSGGALGTGGGVTSGGASGGGAVGGGSSSGGVAGGSTGGADTQSGGTSGGAGSSSGSGGSEGGSGGEGSGGMDSSGGSSGELSPADLVPELDGYLYTGECSGGTASFECPMAGCSGDVFNEQVLFSVGGDETKTYNLTLHIYGVVELRSDYAGGERRKAGASNSQSESDFWYAGGSYTPGAGYNVYGLRVSPAVEGVLAPSEGGNNYFLNARDSSNEAHEVWELNTEAVVPVQGGGSVEFTAYDPNCLQIMNNSETTHTSGSGPNGSIVVDLSATSPEPVAFVQPLSTGGRNGQWIYIDVLAVTPQ